jgi:NADH dehydrogenase
MEGTRPRIVIVGAGFGGLFAARTLAGKPVDVLLIDRENYHTFTPLLYQVATCALDPSEIAYPVRGIFRNNENVHFLLGEVSDIDCEARSVRVRNGDLEREERYDHLILAAGSAPTYFGNEAFMACSLELRTLGDAVELRNHVLRMFERATWAVDPDLNEALTTIVVIGGGPTGLETAGAIYELYNHVLDLEYTQEALRARVLLLEMLPHLLSPFPEELQSAAKIQLESLGVEVMLGNRVEEVAGDHVRLADGTIIPTYTVVWAAGVKASPVTKMMDLALAHSGRLPISPTLEVVGRERVYAIGDMAYLEDPTGEPYPMLIPVAQQQGVLAAKNILATIRGEAPQPFSYYDRGIMATIGRRRAVAWIYNRITLTGFFAWLAWLGLHLLTLLGFRNQVVVLVNWIWNYFTFDRSVRIILEKSTPPAGQQSGL